MELPCRYSTLNSKKRRAVREKYAELQDNACYYCGAPLSGPPREAIKNMKVHPKVYPIGFFKNPVHLHHCHTTDLTIGAVHAHCNAVIFEYHGE